MKKVLLFLTTTILMYACSKDASVTKTTPVTTDTTTKTTPTTDDNGFDINTIEDTYADVSSFNAAIFGALDILKNQHSYDENRKNPLKKLSNSVVAGHPDE